jgi:flagellar motility protein MotE (MotC chaperone)
MPLRRFFIAAFAMGMLGLGVLFEVSRAPEAGASGGASTAPPPAAPAPGAAPSHAELRERVRKRLEEQAHLKEEALAKESSDGPSEKEISDLLAVLKEREKKVAEREVALDKKEKDLEDRQKILQAQLGKYENVLGKLRSDLKTLESAREEKVAAFRQVYEKMESKKAARILDDLDVDLVSRVLGGMKQQQAAEILSKMDPEKARRITKRALSSTPSP